MERKMFGHRMKRKSPEIGRDPGSPHNMSDMDRAMEKNKDSPPGYEGKEHVRYENPGYSSHHIRFPQDEPHMKSHVTRDEEHEAEDDYHMGVPNQTKMNLEKNLKRAHMLMDAPNQQDPKPLRGNIVHNVAYEGEEDTSGEEEMGPNDMQSGDMPKEHRKRMVMAVMKRKMKRASEPQDEGKEEEKNKRKFGPRNQY